MAGRIAPSSALRRASCGRKSARKLRFRCRRHCRRNLAGEPVGQAFFCFRCTRSPALSLETGRPARTTGPPAMRYEVQLASSSGEKKRVIELEREAAGWRVTLDGRPVAVDAVEVAPNIVSILLEGQSFEISVTPSPDGKLKLQTGSREFTAEVIDPRAWSGRRHDNVEAGQGLLVVEAMKMQNEIRSPKSGTLERVLAKEGQPVNAGEVLCVVA